MENTEIFLTVMGMGIATMACRMIPFAVLGNLHMRPVWVAWMRYLPIAILSAVVLPQILMPTGEARWGLISLPLLAAIPTVVVGLWSKNLLVAVVFGVGTLALLRTF